METKADRLRKRLEKKARRGIAGNPIATVAYYGPTDKLASKIVVSILADEQSDPGPMKKWLSEDADVRQSAEILDEVLEFIQHYGARSIAMTPGIYGCPHEEGIDYPLGEQCPECPFWAGKDRNRIFE